MTHTPTNILQRPLLLRLLITLDLVTDLEVLPILEGDTTLSVFAHRLDILLLVLDVVDKTYHTLVHIATLSGG